MGAWSAAGLVVLLTTGNPVYRCLVLAAALAVLLASVGAARSRRPLLLAAVLGAAAAAFNVVLSHLGDTVLFALPAGLPVLGGPYTLEALGFGLLSGATLAAAVLVVAPVSLLVEAHEVVDALPRALYRTGGAVASALNLVPGVAASFTAVAEAQRLRGWRPRGPASWAEIVVPVVLTAIEDSIQLAESMEARAFGSGPRTHWRRARLAAGDRLVVCAAAAAAGLFVLARVLGWAADWAPYPSLTAPDVHPLPAAAALLLAVPALPWSRRSRA
ncbi:MAG TPA: energy-coupling factor transporter transmembrane component T [Candidatus Eisenbacteria bacterium]|nr:energy-coupling factor transporter transmembrane component T [Candidatus Eisenbacteria bacterium]